MLVIRMQRTGRKGHAMFRVVVQDSRRTPSSGKVVASLGSYDPHSKSLVLNKEKAEFYVSHGAQPSPRVARLLKAEGVKLPDWVNLPADKERKVRNADKRRSTMPPAPVEESVPEEPAPADEAVAAEPVDEADPEVETVPQDEVPADPAAEEAPSEGTDKPV